MNRNELASYLTPQKLHLIILPTEQCNFRCTYCYEDFELSRMDSETVESIKHLVRSRINDLSDLTISWFGGEPLLALDIVLDLSNFAKEISLENGVRFHSDMTTNGYSLTPRNFSLLCHSGVNSFQISLDGLDNVHDSTRKLRNGGGTFNVIWNNLLKQSETLLDFSISLRLHVHAENISGIESLINKIHEFLSEDPRFAITLKEVGNWGGETVRAMNLLSSKSATVDFLRSLVESNKKKLLSTPQTPSIGAVKASKNKNFVDSKALLKVNNNDVKKNNSSQNYSVCYAALPNSFVIRSNGSLAKCTVAFSDPRNDIGRLNHDGSITISKQKMHKFMRGFETLDKGELGCPINNMTKEDVVTPILFYQKKESLNI